MKYYVLGFAFDDTFENVLLIQKKHPAWQAGRLNGIGGHVEPGETPDVAMAREFEEECGLAPVIEYGAQKEHKAHVVWKNFIDIRGDDWYVNIFKCFLPEKVLRMAHTTTNEQVMLIATDTRMRNDWLDNLKWLIPMAMDYDIDTNATGTVYHRTP